MMNDILTVAGKELKEIIQARSAAGAMSRGGWLNVLVIIGIFGIFLPYNAGPDWVRTPTTLFLWAWVPMVLVSSVTADSFAGERERHTLETLLASRLSDQAILLGKVAAAVGYGWGLVMVSLVLGVVTVNVAFPEGGPHLYRLDFVAGGALLSLLGAALAASAGVLISLRAGSVRQAAQSLNLVFMLMVLVPAFGSRALPEATRAALVQALMDINASQAVLIALGVLLVLDAALLALAMARFRRAKLILD